MSTTYSNRLLVMAVPHVVRRTTSTNDAEYVEKETLYLYMQERGFRTADFHASRAEACSTNGVIRQQAIFREAGILCFECIRVPYTRGHVLRSIYLSTANHLVGDSK